MNQIAQADEVIHRMERARATLGRILSGVRARNVVGRIGDPRQRAAAVSTIANLNGLEARIPVMIAEVRQVRERLAAAGLEPGGTGDPLAQTELEDLCRAVETTVGQWEVFAARFGVGRPTHGPGKRRRRK